MTPAGYIEGAFVAGEGEGFAVENPSDESVIAEMAGLSSKQIDAAIGAARQAFDAGAWSGLAGRERAAILRGFGRELAARRDRLRQLAVDEAGCPVGSSVMAAQVDTPLKMIDELIDLYLSLPDFEDNPVPWAERIGAQGVAVQSVKRYTPVGVVAAIAAYNVPFYTALIKVLPALLAGNTVILRPNPLTPLSALVFGEAAAKAGLPDGVLNVVIEGGLDGAQALTSDPRVDLVSFTGSCAVAAKVAGQAAPTLKRMILENGGKSAQIFLPDAVDRAPLQAMVIAVAHAGQGCALGTRLLVPEAAKQDMLAQAAAMMQRIRIGPASDPATQTGPVISAAQRDRCAHFVAAAVEQGGAVVCGGRRPAGLDKGYYFEPTLLDLPDNANPAAQEEIFGPVASVIGYRDIDHAIEMANDSRFGLSGYVHGADAKEALRVGLAIRSGTVNINGSRFSSHVSSGGLGMSGLGRERGVEGLRAFQQMTMINLGS